MQVPAPELDCEPIKFSGHLKREATRMRNASDRELALVEQKKKRRSLHLENKLGITPVVKHEMYPEFGDRVVAKEEDLPAPEPTPEQEQSTSDIQLDQPGGYVYAEEEEFDTDPLDYFGGSDGEDKDIGASGSESDEDLIKYINSDSESSSEKPKPKVNLLEIKPKNDDSDDIIDFLGSDGSADLGKDVLDDSDDLLAGDFGTDDEEGSFQLK